MMTLSQLMDSFDFHATIREPPMEELKMESRWGFDVLYGGSVVRPGLSARLLGEPPNREKAREYFWRKKEALKRGQWRNAAIWHVRAIDKLGRLRGTLSYADRVDRMELVLRRKGESR